jgi:hypothetical protein
MVWRPSDRDRAWLKLYHQHKGKIDEAFAHKAFTMPPLAAFSSVDFKFTTTDLAKQLKTVAKYGPPLDRSWQPTNDERQRYSEVRPMISNPYTVLHGAAPTVAKETVKVVDLTGDLAKASNRPKDDVGDADADDDDSEASDPTKPAWHGTLLPKTDADTWLAVAFDRYEKMVSRVGTGPARAGRRGRTAGDKDSLAVELYRCRSDYLSAARAYGDVPLSKVHAELSNDGWYRVSDGKGTLLLHALRQKMGAKEFDAAMDEFGKQFGGKEASTDEFVAHMTKAGGDKVKDFFGDWLNKPGLPDAKTDKGVFTVGSFLREKEETLIVYGTAGDAPAQKEAADLLQSLIRRRGMNVTVPVKSDAEVTDADLKDRHLILIGRPATNRVAEKFKSAFPVECGTASFVVKGETYAHAGTAVLAAGENPLSPRYSVVMFAGLGAEATYHTPERFMGRGSRDCEVIVLPNGGGPKPVVASR